MSTPTASPPEPPRFRPDPAGEPAAPPPRRPTARRRAGVPLAVLLCTSALLGGGVSAGVLAASGALGGRSGGTTTIVRTASSGAAASTGGSGLDPDSLYASASPGVVDITAKGVASGDSASSPFGAPQQQESTTATGTGFVVDAQGHIVTAAHVVDGAASVSVKFRDGTTRTARVLGQDHATDVAVLAVDASGLTLHPLALGASASLDVGDEIAAIGDPFGYERSLSTGIVSGLDRTIQAPNGFTVAHAVQTDAALNPGNSGGPVLNAAGQVVGIVDQIATNGASEQSSGVGFAVPVDLVKSELADLEAGRAVRHAYLGVATSGTAGTSSGAQLAQVTSGGPAAAAGLRSGDVITRIGDAPIADSGAVVAAVATHEPGDEVRVTVRRGSRTLQLTVTLGTQPAQSSSSAG